jgi:hypothetical protein
MDQTATESGHMHGLAACGQLIITTLCLQSATVSMLMEFVTTSGSMSDASVILTASGVRLLLQDSCPGLRVGG